MIGFAIMAASFSISSCMAKEKEEVKVWIGMPTSDFNRQAGAQDLGMRMSDEGADFLGTDDPINLTLVLPNGEMSFDFGPQIGVYLVSSEVSYLDVKPPVPSITSISLPARFSTVQLPAQLGDLMKICDELSLKLGSDFEVRETNQIKLNQIKSGEDVAGHVLCDFVGKDTELSLSFKKGFRGEGYHPTITWGEIVPSN